MLLGGLCLDCLLHLVVGEIVNILAELFEVLVVSHPVVVSKSCAFEQVALRAVDGSPKDSLISPCCSGSSFSTSQRCKLGVNAFAKEEFCRAVEGKAEEEKLYIRLFDPTIGIDRKCLHHVLYMHLLEFQIADIIASKLRTKKGSRMLPSFAIGCKL